jgi:hypothetical protein
MNELPDLVETLVGALLDVEWAAEYGGFLRCCPRCECHSGHVVHDHQTDPPCSLDVALTLAGFPDQASRNAERERRAKR